MIKQKFTPPKEDQWVLELFQTVHKSPWIPGPWIAGGAVMAWVQGDHLDGTDIDVFCHCPEQVIGLGRWLERKGFTKVYSTGNADTYQFSKYSNGVTKKYEVQLIKKQYYNTSQEIIDGFDLNVCRFVFDGTYVEYSKSSYNDLKNKILNINKMNGAVFRRIVKYMSYGFTPSKDTIDTIMSYDELVTDFNGMNEYDTV